MVTVAAAGCADVLVEEMNVPRFIKVDTRSRKRSTMQASGGNRETEVDATRARLSCRARNTAAPLAFLSAKRPVRPYSQQRRKLAA